MKATTESEQKNDVSSTKNLKENVKKRKVTIEAVEKSWKQELAIFDAEKWLSFNRDGKYAINLKCIGCSKYEKLIAGMEYFKRDWILGSKNYRLNNATAQAKSDPHEYTMKKLYEEEGKQFSKERTKG